MNQEKSIHKLTALWAFTEAGLGGILHLFKSPFTGVLVGGLAVVYISLIAFYSPKPFKTILQATLLVLIIKFIASPQSPPTAYLAVGFQGILGAFLFSFLPHFVASVVLGILGFLESAIQKLLVFTFLYGKGFWQAFDVFLAWLLPSFSKNNHLSLFLAAFYVGFYIFMGFLIGLWAARLSKKIDTIPQHPFATLQPILEQSKKRTLSKKTYFFFFIILLFLVFVQGFSQSWQLAFWQFLRTSALLVFWFFLSPILIQKIGSFLSKKQQYKQQEINDLLAFFPMLRAITKYHWHETASLPYWQRLDAFLVRSIQHVLSNP